MRVPPGTLQIGLGPCDKERPRLLEPEEPGEVEVAAVQHVVRPGEEDQHIEGLDVVELAVGDVDDLGEIPAQIEQRVEFDRALGLAKAGPREEREAEIDRRGVEGVHRRGEVHPERLGGIERLGDRHEDLGEVGVDPPVARLVGIRQGAARHAPADAHVVQLGLHRAETRLDVA